MSIETKYQNLLKTLGDEDVVITSTQRLASFLTREWGMIQFAECQSVWVKPSIFAFSSWLKSTWLSIRFFNKKWLLSDLQVHALWQKIIHASGKLSEVLAESVPKLAGEALTLIHQWQLPLPFPAALLSEDMHLFQSWAASFQAVCWENHWLIPSELSEYLASQFKAGTLIPPKKIILIGFSEMNNAWQTLLGTLEALGTHIEYFVDDSSAHQINRVLLDTVEAEVLAMANWAKATLEQNPSNCFIACVVPNLEQRRSIVLNTFNAVFAENKASFELSAPTRFDEISLIDILFKLFALSENRIGISDAGILLRTPFIGNANTERIPRALLDAELKNLTYGDISIDALLQLADQKNKPFYCPLWRQQVLNFRAALAEDTDTKTHLPSVFAEKFMHYLRLLGWPGQRTLTDNELQIIQCFQKILNQLASLDEIVGAMTWKQAKSQLESMAKQILFQPKIDEFAPVQVLGTLEPAGILFTHLWVLGLNDEAWPAAPKPHPFIPLELQCQFGIPHSSASGSLEFSQNLTHQFCQMAPNIIFSSAKQDGDVKLRPSRLLDNFPVIEPEKNVQENLIYAQESIEYLEDDFGFPIALGERVKGGSYLFELQSACPFRAFAEVRLRAKALEKIRGHLNAKEQGTLIHRALELIWMELKSQHNLINTSIENIHGLVLSSVKTAMEEIHKNKVDQLKSGFNRMEEKCLVDLIEKWLILHEKTRPDFKVAALELSQQIELAGRQFQLKIDRIDEICADKKQLIIDYKTGLVSKEDWFGERPNKPQLPLYCVANKTSVDGVLFAQIKAGQLLFKGLVEEGIELKGAQILSSEDWLHHKAEWKKNLENLALQFVNGYAKVDPKEGMKTCQFCELKMFCRVGMSGEK